MQLKHVSKIACMGMALALAGTGSAADVVFTGAADNDLANPANWRPSTWTADDTLVISTEHCTFTEAGLRVSADLPASATILFGAMPDWNLPVDFGGHSLNTSTLELGMMHDDAHLANYVAASGGFSGVREIRNESMKGNIRVVDGVYRVVRRLKLNSWFPYVQIDAGAELVIEDQNNDAGVVMNYDAFGGRFVVDGGRFAILAHSGGDARWQRTYWHGRDDVRCTFSVLNGAVYEDLSDKPGQHFDNIDVTIRDSSYLATNSTYAVRNTMYFGNQDTFFVSNSVFRTAQLYLGQYTTGGDGWYGQEMNFNAQKSTIDFVDSEATFAFAPDHWMQGAGIVVPPGASENVLRFRGENNRVAAPNLVFGGTSNVVQVEDGTFEISRAVELVAGSGNRIAVTGGEATFAGMAVAAESADTRVEVSSGGRLVATGDIQLGGPNGRFAVSDGATLDAGSHGLVLSHDGIVLTVDGASSVGGVRFEANDGRVEIGAGCHHVATYGSGWVDPTWNPHRAPLSFAEGGSGNVLVISNGTYECRTWMAHDAGHVTVGGSESDGIPFTNCPNSRIEFRGTTPKFVVTDARASELSGRPWYALTLGEMIDHETNTWTDKHYRLKDPLRLRYVLPTEGYAEAPCQTTCGQILLLGGNAEFEFDVSGFTWPKRTMRMPLAYDSSGYAGWNGRRYINVEQLNLTNAENLPVSPTGGKARLELASDGKTLNLVLPGCGGTAILIR